MSATHSVVIDLLNPFKELNMFKPTNFSDRFKSALSGFQKAHNELTALREDVVAEKNQAELHVAKLHSSLGEIDGTLENLKPFVKTDK